MKIVNRAAFSTLESVMAERERRVRWPDGASLSVPFPFGRFGGTYYWDPGSPSAPNLTFTRAPGVPGIAANCSEYGLRWKGYDVGGHTWTWPERKRIDDISIGDPQRHHSRRRRTYSQTLEIQGDLHRGGDRNAQRRFSNQHLYASTGRRFPGKIRFWREARDGARR